MKTYDLYSITNYDLNAARQVIERVLGVSLVPHESSYIGDYYLGKSNNEEYQLRKNIDPLDGEPVMSAVPVSSILLYVNETQRAPEIERKLLAGLPGTQLLHRKNIET